MDDLIKVLDGLKGKAVSITFHKSADIDAVSSAFALQRYIGGEIVVADELDPEAQIFAKEMNIHFADELRDYIIVVDSHAPTLLTVDHAYLIIDHHRLMERSIPADYSFIFPEAAATAEILALALPRIDKQSARALAAGILSDTARFKVAGPRTFEAFAKMRRICGAEYKDLLKLAFPQISKELRLEIIEDMRNAEIIEAGRYLIAVVNARSLGLTASALTEIGIDVAIAYGDGKMSVRGGTWNPIHLGELVNTVAKETGGRGGGHFGAAGMFYTSEESVRRLVEELKRRLSAE